jgi:hypothetical protein
VIFNFTDNPPHVGENDIPLAGTAVVFRANSISGFSPSSGEGSTITYRGTVVANDGITYPVFDLIVPTLSLTAKNLRGDGTVLVLPDGGEVRATVSTMTYTALGMWTYHKTSSPSGAYISYANTGSATPAANVPSTGTAVFKGSGTMGGVIGTYWEPSPTGTVQGGSLKGNAEITVNFASDSFAGTFNNMTATPSGGVATPWNDVTFSGTLARASNVGASARTNASSPPDGAAAGFSSAATGLLQGGFNGPNAEELGGSWTLSEQTSAGGKVAIGSFGAAR